MTNSKQLSMPSPREKSWVKKRNNRAIVWILNMHQQVEKGTLESFWIGIWLFGNELICAYKAWNSIAEKCQKARTHAIPIVIPKQTPLISGRSVHTYRYGCGFGALLMKPRLFTCNDLNKSGFADSIQILSLPKTYR